jgi:hypothetical protein
MNTGLGAWLNDKGKGRSGRAAWARGMSELLVLALLVGFVRPAMAGEGTADAKTSGVNLPVVVTKPTAMRLLARTEMPIVVAQAPAQVVYVANCPAPPPPPEPSYWPLWVAAGAVLVAGAIVGVMVARQSTDLAMPTTTFGTKKF